MAIPSLSKAICRDLGAVHYLSILARDRGCSAPGCDVPGYLTEVHHCTPWATAHTTDVNELTLACGPQHDLHRTRLNHPHLAAMLSARTVPSRSCHTMPSLPASLKCARRCLPPSGRRARPASRQPALRQPLLLTSFQVVTRDRGEPRGWPTMCPRPRGLGFRGREQPWGCGPPPLG
jgi:hypothetical protein